MASYPPKPPKPYKSIRTLKKCIAISAATTYNMITSVLCEEVLISHNVWQIGNPAHLATIPRPTILNL